MFRRLFPHFFSLLLTFSLAFGIPLTGNGSEVARQDKTELVSQQKKRSVYQWFYESAKANVPVTFSSNLEIFHSLQAEVQYSQHDIGYAHLQSTFKYYYFHPTSDEIPLI